MTTKPKPDSGERKDPSAEAELVAQVTQTAKKVSSASSSSATWEPPKSGEGAALMKTEHDNVKQPQTVLW